MTILRKVEARLEKARGEVETLRWHARLNPARRLRLKSYDRMLAEARRL